jgi:mitochondrial distribution and morphology protein 31
MDLNINWVDVKLSILHLLAGRGILKELSLQGVEGTVNRKNIVWSEDYYLNPPPKRKQSSSDFHFDRVKVKDLNITIFQNCPDRPLSLNIFSMKLSRLRQHWLLYDLLAAETVHGKFDDCLLSVEAIGKKGSLAAQRVSYDLSKRYALLDEC